MRKFIKYSLITFAVFLVLFSTGAVIFWLTFDINSYKGEMEKFLESHVNGDVSIGNLQTSLENGFTIEISETKITGQRHEKFPILETGKIKAWLGLREILTFTPRATLEISSPTIMAILEKDGTINISNLFSGETAEMDADSAPSPSDNVELPAILLAARAGIEIRGAKLLFLDLDRKQKIKAEDLSISIPDISLSSPIEMNISGKLKETSYKISEENKETSIGLSSSFQMSAMFDPEFSNSLETLEFAIDLLSKETNLKLLQKSEKSLFTKASGTLHTNISGKVLFSKDGSMKHSGKLLLDLSGADTTVSGYLTKKSGIPFSLATGYNFSGKTVSFESLALTLGKNTLKSQKSSIKLATNTAQASLSLSHLDTTDLAELVPAFFIPPLVGSLSLEAEVKGPIATPELMDGLLKLNMKELKLPLSKLPKAKVKGLQYSGEGTVSGTIIAKQNSGQLSAGADISADCSSMQLNYTDSIKKKKSVPCSLTLSALYSGSEIRVKKLKLQLSNLKTSASGKFNTTGKNAYSLKLTIPPIDISDLENILSDASKYPLRGKLKLDLDSTGTLANVAKGAHKGTLVLTNLNGEIPPELIREKVPELSISGNSSLSIVADFSLKNGKAKKLKINASADFKKNKIVYADLFHKPAGRSLNLKLLADGSGKEISLKKAFLQLGKSKISIPGKIYGIEKPKFSSKNASIDIPLQDLLTFIPGFSTYKISGQLKGKAGISGYPMAKDPRWSYTGNLKFSGGSLRMPDIPAATRIKTGISIKGDTFSVKNMSFLFGGFPMNLSATLRDYTKLSFTYSTPELNLDKLFPESGSSTSSAAKSSAASKSSSGTSGTDSMAVALAAIRKDPLFNKLQLAGKVKIGKGRARNIKFSNLSGMIYFKKLVLAIQDLSLNGYGGSVKANTSLDIRKSSPLIVFKGKIDNIRVHDLLKEQKSEAASQIIGRFFASADVKSSGLLPAQIMKNLTGTGDFSLKDGRLPAAAKMAKEVIAKVNGINIPNNQDLQNFKNKLNQLEYENDRVKLCRSGFSAENGKISTKRLECRLENGFGSILSGEMTLPAMGIEYAGDAIMPSLFVGPDIEKPLTDPSDKRVHVPLKRVYNTLFDPRYQIDVGLITKKLINYQTGKVRKKFEKEAKQKIDEKKKRLEQDLKKGIEDKFKGIFGN